MKILVIQQKMIGDVLTSTILLEALRRKFPNAELHYLINAHTFPVVENNPFIDSFLFFDAEMEKNILKLWPLLKTIRTNNYDILVDSYSKLSSNILSFLSKAKIKISFYKKHSSFIYKHNVIRDKHTESTIGLEISNRLKLLEPLDIKVDNIKPNIYLTENESVEGMSFLRNSRIDLDKAIFMISVLGSEANKTYPFQYMAEIIDTVVAKTNGQILFNYIPTQKTDAKEIFNLCKPKTQRQIFFNVFGKSLRQFLTITKHCTAVIGNEGGAINMAKALNIPTFAIFSPWINKNGWNMFEDERNISIHLIEMKPSLFENIEMKSISNNSKPFYNAFTPDLILPKLKDYLEQFKQ